MTAETLRIIVDGLNGPPFNRGTSLVAFDALPNQKLLQTLSDVLSWIQDVPPVDIRSEAPDETMMRILNALRILKYPPPRDMDHIQKWRLQLLEGEKAAIYPVFEWIFTNVERLKERVYLAKYLTMTEVPPEEMTPEIQRLLNSIADKMDEFKVIHQRIVESRADFARAEDVRADLAAMDEEKEQLQRKIDRVRKIMASRQGAERFLGLAGELRVESEKADQLALEKQTQRNALVHIEQRVMRLTKMKADLEAERETINPEKVIAKLKGEIESNSYLVHEKLAKEIAMHQKNVQGVNRILTMKNVTAMDIGALKKKIEALNDDIIQAATERDKLDEQLEDKLSVFRHQSQNTARRKQAIADEFQAVRRRLEKLEQQIARKKRDLMDRSGQSELITSAQFKRYVAALRVKTTTYKRKKSELEDAEHETKILQRTLEILERNWGALKRSLESQGRGVIVTISAPVARPRTAKPTTKDVSALRNDAAELAETLETKKANVERLKAQLDSFASQHKVLALQYETKREKFNVMKAELDREQAELEQTTANLQSSVEKLQNDREKLLAELEEKDWLTECIKDPGKAATALETMTEDHSTTLANIDPLRARLREFEDVAGATEQIAMWQGLVTLFEQKIQVAGRVLRGSAA